MTAKEAQTAMPDNKPAFYPDFFKTGIARLQGNGSVDEVLVALLASLQQFQRDMKHQTDVKSILRQAHLYLDGLNLVDASAFYLVNPEDLSFELAFHAPETALEQLKPLIETEMKSGHFAWTLRQETPVFIDVQPDDPAAGRMVLHPMHAANRTIGMFCGLLKRQRGTRQDIIFSLLSILLNATGDALDTALDTANLKQTIFATNQGLQKALEENRVLAQIPAESPSPVIRCSRKGQVLYSNDAGLQVLRQMGYRVGDLISGQWFDVLETAFTTTKKQEFEFALSMNPAAVGAVAWAAGATDTPEHRVFTFMVVAVDASQYANFYGTDITERKRAETQRQKMIDELKSALQSVNTLSGLLPICAVCKKIRDDKGYWNNVESYIATHSTAQFSHGICPDCLQHRYGHATQERPPVEKPPTP